MKWVIFGIILLAACFVWGVLYMRRNANKTEPLIQEGKEKLEEAKDLVEKVIDKIKK